MNEAKEKLIMVGAGEFGGIAYEYFSGFSNHEVAAFAVGKASVNNKSELSGLPVLSLEKEM